MLYAHDPKAPGVVGFTRELHGVLRTEWPGHVEVYEEALDFDRLGDHENWSLFAAYLANKYNGFRIDAVVAEGSTALQLAVENVSRVFPDVPIVYGNVFEPVVDEPARNRRAQCQHEDFPRDTDAEQQKPRPPSGAAKRHLLSNRGRTPNTSHGDE